MSRDSSGTYTLPAGNPVVGGTIIESSWANNTMDDLGAEITNSLSRTGKGGMLATLKLLDGDASTPSLAFSSEVALGLYRAGAARLGFSVAGVSRGVFTATGLEIVDQPTIAAHTARKDYVDAGDIAVLDQLSAHLAEAVDAHDASAISYVPSGDLVATEVQAALDELEAEKATIVYVDAQDAILQANIDANTTDIATNTADIATLETGLSLIGAVQLWVSATIPNGYLELNGQSIDSGADSRLQDLVDLLNPGGNTTATLPDLRGEFVRGLDSGRGVDTGRVLLSAQTDQFQGHTLVLSSSGNKLGTKTSLGGVTGNRANFLNPNDEDAVIGSDGTNGTPRTGAETRPRNIAMIYIIRAFSVLA